MLYVPRKNACSGYSMLEMLMSLGVISVVLSTALTAVQFQSSNDGLKQFRLTFYRSIESTITTINSGCPGMFGGSSINADLPSGHSYLALLNASGLPSSSQPSVRVSVDPNIIYSSAAGWRYATIDISALSENQRIARKVPILIQTDPSLNNVQDCIAQEAFQSLNLSWSERGLAVLPQDSIVSLVTTIQNNFCKSMLDPVTGQSVCTRKSSGNPTGGGVILPNLNGI